MFAVILDALSVTEIVLCFGIILFCLRNRGFLLQINESISIDLNVLPSSFNASPYATPSQFGEFLVKSKVTNRNQEPKIRAVKKQRDREYSIDHSHPSAGILHFQVQGSGDVGHKSLQWDIKKKHSHTLESIVGYQLSVY